MTAPKNGTGMYVLIAAPAAGMYVPILAPAAGPYFTIAERTAYPHTANFLRILKVKLLCNNELIK